MKTLFAPILVATALFATPAAAGPPAAKPAPEARIPFVNHGGIRNWRAIDRDTLYIEDSHRRWYRAELMGPCFDLGFTERIGFETRGNDTFDRFSTIRVGRDRCPVQSLVAVPGPPPKKAKRLKGS
ncbi:DUF6491 family protein [Sphingosinicella rhizophila]|uniref:DUF6491 family protein n=1 Tax=Sphingosinicella rhizophila TaxID=3050082 RepID=A0ABU3QC57_9SPHN|nr:DUF6491 family protein [Sphingosinicella sp. GR2756]MDT9600976.1 DUF6491 family protein [Sphingosinicella sp. GR2756]